MTEMYIISGKSDANLIQFSHPTIGSLHAIYDPFWQPSTLRRGYCAGWASSVRRLKTTRLRLDVLLV